MSEVVRLADADQFQTLQDYVAGKHHPEAPMSLSSGPERRAGSWINLRGALHYGEGPLSVTSSGRLFYLEYDDGVRDHGVWFTDQLDGVLGISRLYSDASTASRLSS